MAMENGAQTTAYFKESVDGIETIKALNMEQNAKEKTGMLFERLISTVFKQSVMYNNLGVVIGVVTSLGTVFILWLGVQSILQEVLTLGALITFNALLGYFLTPLGSLINLQPQLQAAGVAANRLNDILLAEKEDTQTGLSGGDLKGDIVFKSVSFRYGSRDLVLKDISLMIGRGQKVAIVGESGSGKTTLMKLLLRFYKTETGSILIDGLELDAVNKTFLRKRISYLTQNIFLFSDTIKSNILYGCDFDEISDEEFRQICGLCKVDEFVSNLPFGYETRLEENGMNLSGGQRQRIALARALLRRPDVLVLDEAMSNLDSITERALSNMISDFDTDMTCIIIAHRLSTIVQCEKILVMSQGQITETGSHSELMEKRGKYFSFWRDYEE
jgi:ATP-binding cassette subfamily B protein